MGSKDIWLFASIACLAMLVWECVNLGQTVAKYRVNDSDKTATASTAVAESVNPSNTSTSNIKKTEAIPARRSDVPTQNSVVAADSNPAVQSREPAAPKKVKAVSQEFTYNDPNAKEVLFYGSWSGSPYKMELKGGVWRFKALLKPGEYAYHFRVDNEWKVNPGPLNKAGENTVKVFPAE